MAKSVGKDKRKVRQRQRKRYSKLREDLQLKDEIATTPEGAVERRSNPHVKGEVVDPASQSQQLIVDLVLKAAKDNWATPDKVKPVVVAELAGVIADPDAKPMDKIMAANALGKLDQIQWDRDNPKAVPDTQINVGVGVQVSTGDLIRQVLTGVEAQKRFGKELSDDRIDAEGEKHTARLGGERIAEERRDGPGLGADEGGQRD